MYPISQESNLACLFPKHCLFTKWDCKSNLFFCYNGTSLDCIRDKNTLLIATLSLPQVNVVLHLSTQNQDMLVRSLDDKEQSMEDERLFS